MPDDVLSVCEVGEHRVSLRRARRTDVPALAALFGADPVSAARGDSGEGDLSDYERAFAGIDADDRHLLVVATEGEGTGGPVVGTLQLSFLPGLARRGAWRGHIEAVHVAASQRGRGVGGWMIGWAVDEARRRGCGLVQLTSAVERADAHRFYERLGFVATHVGFKRSL